LSRTKRARDIPMLIYFSQSENDLVLERMREAGIKSKSAFMRKIALNGYVIYEKIKKFFILTKNRFT
jgi:hypothetical protein